MSKIGLINKGKVLIWSKYTFVLKNIVTFL